MKGFVPDTRGPIDLPAIPRDQEGPVFRAPWEAQAFAMAVKLHEAGYFTWSEWAERLAQEIKRAQEGGDPDRKSTRLNSSHSAKSRMPSSA